MSLLMQALKNAEEKKQSQSRNSLDLTARGPAPQEKSPLEEITLFPLESPPADTTAPAVHANTHNTHGGLYSDPARADETEPSRQKDWKQEPQPLAYATQTNQAGTEHESAGSGLPPSAREADAHDAGGLAQTTATAQRSSGVHPTESDHPAESGKTDSPAAAPAAAAEVRLKSNQPGMDARQKAKAVFISKQPGNRKRSISIAGGIIFAAVLAGAAYLYWATMPPVVPYTAVAAQHADMPQTQADAAPAAPDEAETASQTGQPVITASTGTDAASPTATPAMANPTAAPATALPPVSTAAPLSPAATSATNAPPSLPARMEEARTPAADASMQNRAAADSKPARSTAAIQEDGPLAIQFKRSTAANPINPMMIQAYQAYVDGDMPAAQRLYQSVLQQDPNKRDALLGMALIALKRQQPDMAGDYFLRMLDADPSDPDAIAGLVTLRQGDPVQSESRLKKALAQNPQSGPVLFALGNLYAQQSRWADAQQSYFRAYTSAPDNADYTFNLAISLDRLNQARLALDYYRRTLALAADKQVNFNKSAIQLRINELQAVTN